MIRMMWHEILILMIYEVIILIAIIPVVKLVKDVYRLCNFNKLKMPPTMVSKIAVQLKCWEIKTNIFISNFSNKC